jgi:hypothetical protein
MSELKVNKVTPRSGTTVTLGDSGDTITIPSGATITNSGTATGFGGTNTPAFEAFSTGIQSITNATYTKMEMATEVFDTDSAYDNATNYRFTPQTAGKYFCYAKGQSDGAAYENEEFIAMRFHKNNSAVSHTVSEVQTGGNSSTDGSTATTHTISSSIEFNGTTDYLEVFFFFDTWNNINAGVKNKLFGAYKIIE